MISFPRSNRLRRWCTVRCRSTHNAAEGAGAAALAALMHEKSLMAGKRVGVILSGGNIDTDQFTTVMQGRIPQL